MAAFDNTITITSTKYRPCYVDGEKALFHRWTDKEKIIIKPTVHLDAETIADMMKVYDEYGLLMSGLDCEKQQTTLAIVEYADGTITEVAPSSIKFADDKIKEYAFFSPADFNGLRADYEALLKRFCHLTKSEVIRQYDVIDGDTQEYKKDILKLDAEFKKYKEAFEILSACTNCNTCIKSRDCAFIKWGDDVKYNCPLIDILLKAVDRYNELQEDESARLDWWNDVVDNIQDINDEKEIETAIAEINAKIEMLETAGE